MHNFCAVFEPQCYCGAVSSNCSNLLEIETNFSLCVLTGSVDSCVCSETKKFYSLLSRIGTDFSLMCRLFPGRNRPELKVCSLL